MRRIQIMKIGTWNIQVIATKQTEIHPKVERLDIDVVVLSKTKKTAKEEEIIGGYTQIWSGVPKPIYLYFVKNVKK